MTGNVQVCGATKGRNWLPYFPHLFLVLERVSRNFSNSEMRPSFAKSKFFTLIPNGLSTFLSVSESNRAPFTLTQWERNLEIGIIMCRTSFTRRLQI